MDSDRRIELCFGGAAVDRNGQPLNDFSRFRPDHVAAKHSVAGTVDYQFHHRFLRASGHRVPQRPERAHVDIDLEFTTTRLLFG